MLYHFRLNFNDHNSTSVDQVDLVPTFSLLMGIPIPFSNLGRVIRGLWSAGEEASSLLK